MMQPIARGQTALRPPPDHGLRRAAWTVLRYDWSEVTYDAARVAREIAETYGALAAVA
jgi:hypothetical protein